MMFATSSALLSSAYPPGERGRVLGINVATVYMRACRSVHSSAVSSRRILAGAAFSSWVWRRASLAALVALQPKAEWAEARGERFDWIGSAIYGASIAAGDAGPFAAAGSSRRRVGCGGACRARSVSWPGRDRTPAPILNLSLFRGNRTFTFSSLAALINYLATTAVTFLLSLYLQYIKGLTPQAAGVILVAQPIMMALCLAPCGTTHPIGWKPASLRRPVWR